MHGLGGVTTRQTCRGVLVVVSVDAVSHWAHVMDKLYHGGGMWRAPEHKAMGFPIDVLSDGLIPRVSFGQEGHKRRASFGDR